MKHGRSDYNARIVDLAALSEVEVLALIKALREGNETEHPIEEDEPVFLLRASDSIAPLIVREYARLCRQRGTSWLVHASIIDVAKSMEEWALQHGAKIPDLPREKAGA